MIGKLRSVSNPAMARWEVNRIEGVGLVERTPLSGNLVPKLETNCFR